MCTHAQYYKPYTEAHYVCEHTCTFMRCVYRSEFMLKPSSSTRQSRESFLKNFLSSAWPIHTLYLHGDPGIDHNWAIPSFIGWINSTKRRLDMITCNTILRSLLTFLTMSKVLACFVSVQRLRTEYVGLPGSSGCTAAPIPNYPLHPDKLSVHRLFTTFLPVSKL